MIKEAKRNPMPMLGVDELWWAELLKDLPGGDPEYDAPERLPGLVSIGVTRSAQTATFYADNSAYVTASQMGDMTAAVACADILPETLSRWQGFKYEDGGLLVGQINPIEMCLSYRVKKANSAYRYIRMYKAKPAFSDSTVNTQAGTIAFQNGTTNFGLAMLISTGIAEYWIDDDSPELPDGITADVIARNFFADPLWTPADGDKHPPEGGTTPPSEPPEA